MAKEYPGWWMILQLVGWAIIGATLMLPVHDGTSLFLSFLLILLVGIPHGAADHHLFTSLYGRHFGATALGRFYLAYLGLMGAFALLWWLLPAAAFAVFIGISAYHFGQSNYHYLSVTGGWRIVMYCCWGGFVVLAPIGFHFAEARPIVQQLLGGVRLELSPGWAKLLPWVLLAVNGLLLLSVAPRLSPTLLLREALNLGVLALLFAFTPLLLGFALYFAGWHAGPSAWDQFRFLRRLRPGFSFRDYVRLVLPYSLLAGLGVVAIFLWAGNGWHSSRPWAFLFVFIAVLTLPHMLLLDQVYAKLHAAEGRYPSGFKPKDT